MKSTRLPIRPTTQSIRGRERIYIELAPAPQNKGVHYLDLKGSYFAMGIVLTLFPPFSWAPQLAYPSIIV